MYGNPYYFDVFIEYCGQKNSRANPAIFYILINDYIISASTSITPSPPS